MHLRVSAFHEQETFDGDGRASLSPNNQTPNPLGRAGSHDTSIQPVREDPVESVVCRLAGRLAGRLACAALLHIPGPKRLAILTASGNRRSGGPESVQEGPKFCKSSPVEGARYCVTTVRYRNCTRQWTGCFSVPSGATLTSLTEARYVLYSTVRCVCTVEAHTLHTYMYVAKVPYSTVLYSCSIDISTADYYYEVVATRTGFSPTVHTALCCTYSTT